MSGHNPHSHLSQPPNSSWNPLQIPSYIPRQPQVAHMSSNERSLVRSPLTWHTPTPPEALYGFISTKHKNLEINPLSFVRGPPPFGSVDLTIQSNRNNTSSPRNLSSPSSDYISLHNKQISHNVITNSLQSSGVGLGPGVIQTTGSVRDKFSNGTNCGDIIPPVSSSSGCGGGGLYIRDARQINNDLLKLSSRDPNEITSMMNEQPVELINQSAKLHAVSTSPRRLSPHRGSSLLNHHHHHHHTSIPHESTSPAPSNCSLDLVSNNHMSSQPPSSQQQIYVSSSTAVTNEQQIMANDNSPSICSAVPSPSNIPSNDDSVDSNTSKTRRRRKPNRIIRVPNDSDDSLPANEKPNIRIYKKDVNEAISSSSHNSDKNENCLKLNNDKIQSPLNPIGLADSTNIPKIDNHIENKSHHHYHHHHTHHHHHHHLQQQQQQQLQQPKDNLNNFEDRSSNNNWSKSVQMAVISQEKSVIVDNAVVTTPTNLSMNDSNQCRLENNAKATVIERPKPQNSNKDDTYNNSNSEVSLRNCLNTNFIIKQQTRPKGDQDDIETIDKIAAMIANSNENEEIGTNVNGINNLNQREIHMTKNEGIDQTGNKLSDLTEILSTPIVKPDNCSSSATTTKNIRSSQENAENISKEMHFEEVENKLEEMFAGIEDEAPPVKGMQFSQTSNDPALELEALQTDKNNHVDDIMIIDTNIPSTSKRLCLNSPKKPTQQSQSFKQSDVPPKKKKKIAPAVSTPKKSSVSNQKKSKKQKQMSKSSLNNKSVREKIQDKDDYPTVSNNCSQNDFKYKGPYVQLKPDGSINIVNAPIAEDDTEKQSKAKKTLQSHSISERSKIRGMHISTLSTKYDADTIDATWMCVFCKKGPHKEGLGDLFGPYVVTTTCDEFQLSQKNPLEDEFVSKRTKAQMVQKFHNIPVVAAASIEQKQQPSTSGSTNTKKKKKVGINAIIESTIITLKSTQINELPVVIDESKDIFYGMLKVSDTSYEVWMHEDCAVWAPGVYMIGSRIIGLESAVWSSTQYKCDICFLNGALICCLQRGCCKNVHKSCARNSNWALIEHEFKSYCDKHFSASTSVVVFDS